MLPRSSIVGSILLLACDLSGTDASSSETASETGTPTASTSDAGTGAEGSSGAQADSSAGADTGMADMGTADTGLADTGAATGTSTSGAGSDESTGGPTGGPSGAAYGPCPNGSDDCPAGTECQENGGPLALSHWCAAACMDGDGTCPPAPDGDAEPVCFGFGDTGDCALGCGTQTTCPEGMECRTFQAAGDADGLCIWPL